MSGSDYLVDTNILIHLGNGDESITDFLQGKVLFVSFITEMELLSKPGLSPENIKILKSLIDNCILVEFNHKIKSEAIKLRRQYRLKLPDAIIAATAKYLHLPLLTTDKDFNKIIDIELLFIS
ncbi:MAG TPA: type II toxin-antitoxin system VapC family toxin [Cyclobacteriaceae bacterium]